MKRSLSKISRQLKKSFIHELVSNEQNIKIETKELSQKKKIVKRTGDKRKRISIRKSTQKTETKSKFVIRKHEHQNDIKQIEKGELKNENSKSKSLQNKKN